MAGPDIQGEVHAGDDAVVADPTREVVQHVSSRMPARAVRPRMDESPRDQRGLERMPRGKLRRRRRVDHRDNRRTEL